VKAQKQSIVQLVALGVHIKSVLDIAIIEIEDIVHEQKGMVLNTIQQLHGVLFLRN
jgi:hypothetical protein